MSRWNQVQDELRDQPRSWVVTGAAGFIGSHLVETLLELGQDVVGVDDFSTGSRANLADVESLVGESAWSRFRLIQGSVADLETCTTACSAPSVHGDRSRLVLHQAALGSVPRSIAEPVPSFHANVIGFVTILEAARQSGSERFVYASSSSVYGDHPGLPKVEASIGDVLSPYAASKRMDEVWAGALHRSLGVAVTGLRYFNVFGPRQDPNGPYAAVIPRWIESFRRGETPTINGDGLTSRDFCPVANAVQANILAALGPDRSDEGEDLAAGRSFNVALGGRTSLLELFDLIRDGLAERGLDCAEATPVHADFRAGDVRHSLADLTDVRSILGFEPDVDFAGGIERTLDWYAGRPTASSLG